MLITTHDQDQDHDHDHDQDHDQDQDQDHGQESAHVANLLEQLRRAFTSSENDRSRLRREIRAGARVHVHTERETTPADDPRSRLEHCR